MIAEGCEVGWVRAFSMGKGPPYIRPQDVTLQAGPTSVWDSPRRITRKVDEMQRQGRMLMVKSEQTHFAVGLLGFSEVLDKLVLSDTMNAVTDELGGVKIDDDDDDDEEEEDDDDEGDEES